MEKNIPVYKVVVNDATELDFISLVDNPAIIEKGLAFNEQTELVTHFNFNKDKQIVAGPAMIPDMPLYRYSKDIGEYYVVFTKEAIEQIVEKFNKNPKEFKINVDHNDIVKEAFIKGGWMIEDAQYDKSKMYGFDLPIGTYFVEVKIDDSEFWNREVKDKGKFGFSVEGNFGLQKINFNKEEKMEQITDLTPEEIAMILDYRKKKDEPKVEVEVAAAVEDVVVPDAIAPEAVVVDPVAPAISESEVIAIVQPKLDEIYSMIAEIKKMIEEGSAPIIEDKVIELSNVDAKFEKLRKLAGK